jgi:hypothetical protein
MWAKRELLINLFSADLANLGVSGFQMHSPQRPRVRRGGAENFKKTPRVIPGSPGYYGNCVLVSVRSQCGTSPTVREGFINAPRSPPRRSGSRPGVEQHTLSTLLISLTSGVSHANAATIAQSVS